MLKIGARKIIFEKKYALYDSSRIDLEDPFDKKYQNL